MKKLLAIICVLIIIFICVCIYREHSNKTQEVTADEAQRVQDYISKIYMWKEVTDEALPKFENINNAPDKWIWEVVKKNLENSELTYNEITQKATELFGNQFTKQFPKEGTEYMQYNKDLDEYISTGMGLDSLDDSFLVKNITKTKEGYQVEIAEYLVDYSNSIDALNADTITTISSTEISGGDTKIIEKVKENIDKFTTKKVNLVKENEKIYIQSVE